MASAITPSTEKNYTVSEFLAVAKPGNFILLIRKMEACSVFTTLEYQSYTGTSLLGDKIEHYNDCGPTPIEVPASDIDEIQFQDENKESRIARITQSIMDTFTKSGSSTTWIESTVKERWYQSSVKIIGEIQGRNERCTGSIF